MRRGRTRRRGTRTGDDDDMDDDNGDNRNIGTLENITTSYNMVTCFK